MSLPHRVISRGIVWACLLTLSACSLTKSNSLGVTAPSSTTHKSTTSTVRVVNQGMQNALLMFVRACDRSPWQRDISSPYPIDKDDWMAVCATAKEHSNENAHHFFDRYFIQKPIAQEGLFTGYFAAEVAISTAKDAEYRFPIHGPPTSEISLTRAEIADQPEHAPILYYAKDPIEVFVLHIQGSGEGVLPNGRRVPLGFAAHNNQQYYSIGRYLIERGQFRREDITWPAIEGWLRTLSETNIFDILHKNPRYIYFSQKNQPPTGSLGAPLIAEASMAIDPEFVPLGLPLWLEASPITQGGPPYHRLLISADTGAAIKGEVRGDVYFGFGTRARDLAGRMKSMGKLTLYIPRMPIN